MKCAIISIGTELLMGQVVDTNAVYLSQRLRELGFDVLYRYTVGDNDGRLTQILDEAFSSVDLVITSGGLGPTEDDMTKETITAYMGDTLVEHEPSKQALMAMAKERNHPFTKNNLRQIMMPTRATVFATDVGTAPGFSLKSSAKEIICLPGPPREMKTMFQRRVRPYLEQYQTDVIVYKMLRIFGRGESRVETDLLDLIDRQREVPDPTIATYAKDCECSVRVASKRHTEAEAEAALKPVVDEIRSRLGEWIFSENDEELVDVVGHKLIDRGITISSAESCTGGLFAGAITGVPGISAVFERSVVTYNYKAKMEELGVSGKTLEEKTAVSPEVCRQMLDGLYKKTGSDVCVAVTGNAGPTADGDTPVGLIYVGCRYQDKTVVKEVLTLNISRDWNRHYAVLAMLDTVNRMIDGKPVPLTGGKGHNWGSPSQR